jgi:hypothetical protein
MIVVQAGGRRPRVTEEPCRVTLHLADDAEFLCMKTVKLVGPRRVDHTQHEWKATPDGFGWGERVRIEWTA